MYAGSQSSRNCMSWVTEVKWRLLQFCCQFVSKILKVHFWAHLSKLHGWFIFITVIQTQAYRPWNSSRGGALIFLSTRPSLSKPLAKTPSKSDQNWRRIKDFDIQVLLKRYEASSMTGTQSFPFQACVWKCILKITQKLDHKSRHKVTRYLGVDH